jgi:hypothetical protein
MQSFKSGKVTLQDVQKLLMKKREIYVSLIKICDAFDII